MLNVILKVLNPRFARRININGYYAGYKTNAKRILSLQEAKKEIYERHKELLYSSYIECDLVQFSNRTLNGSTFSTTSQRNEKDKETNMNWMHDYEFYEAAVDEDGSIDSTFGSADPTIPASIVSCNGCGAHLHCTKISLPGYIPSEIFRGRTQAELQTMICQRCYFLKHYNIALDVEVNANTYIEAISKIKNKFALAIVIVDLMDFPCSIWPGLADMLGPKRPVFIVGNKVDLLPRDSNGYLDRIKTCLQDQVLQSGFDKLNVKYVSLISAKTGYGIEELITQLHKIWRYKGDVYLMGCTNVGKSSLFNILLNSDYCRPEASKLVRKATTCPWPGTTLHMLKFPILRPSEIRVYQRFQRLFSERGRKAAEEKLRRDQAKESGSVQKATLVGTVGRTFEKHEEVNDAFVMTSGTSPITTLNENSAIYREAKWCYDTPGVLHPAQITNLLTTEELLQLQPNQMITPRALRLPIDCSLFIAGLARLDFIGKQQMQREWIKVVVFSALQLPLLIVRTSEAEMVYKNYLGTPFFGVPCGTSERLGAWPGLRSNNEAITVVGTNKNQLDCDILLSSAGWIGLCVGPGEECSFLPWTPEARGIFVRTPPLIPFAENLLGKHIRDSLAYNLSKPFVFRK